MSWIKLGVTFVVTPSFLTCMLFFLLACQLKLHLAPCFLHSLCIVGYRFSSMFFFQLQWFVWHLRTLLTRMSLSTPSPWKCQPFDQTVLMPDLRRLTRNLLSSALLPVKFSFIISLHPFQGGCWTVNWPDLLPAIVRALQDPEAPPVGVEFFPAFRVLQLSPVCPIHQMIWWLRIFSLSPPAQGCKARKVNCCRIYSEHILKPVLWVEFVNKNRFLRPEYFIDFFLCERWIPCQTSTSVLC